MSLTSRSARRDLDRGLPCRLIVIMRRLTTRSARIGPDAKGAADEPIGRISRAARAGRPVPVADPQELPRRHAGRRHHLRRRRRLIEQIKKDQGPEQVANVATLPGIQKASLAMPDIHWGYGFCIGGVAATDPEEGGVISPGGVGYDINCGVRLLRTNLAWSEVKDRIKPLVDQLFRDIPTGVGQSGRYLFDKPKLTRLMEEGASYVVDLGYGTEHDLLVTEAGGCLDGADPGAGQRSRDHARL